MRVPSLRMEIKEKEFDYKKIEIDEYTFYCQANALELIKKTVIDVRSILFRKEVYIREYLMKY